MKIKLILILALFFIGCSPDTKGAERHLLDIVGITIEGDVFALKHKKFVQIMNLITPQNDNINQIYAYRYNKILIAKTASNAKCFCC